jgi:hypothetical protein
MQSKPFSKSVAPAAPATASPERYRVTVDVPSGIAAVLDQYCEVTGQNRSSVVLSLIVQNLAALDDQSQALRQRAQRATAKR